VFELIELDGFYSIKPFHLQINSSVRQNEDKDLIIKSGEGFGSALLLINEILTGLTKISTTKLAQIREKWSQCIVDKVRRKGADPRTTSGRPHAKHLLILTEKSRCPTLQEFHAVDILVEFILRYELISR
jgi:hypothetical protein